MTNLELLKYLRENRIISFDEDFNSNYKENVISVWDWDGWHEVLIWFDKEGDVIDK